MDPFAGVPVFMTLTKGRSLNRMRVSANRAAKVAGLLLTIFVFMGKSILDFFNISLEALMIGGGIVMVIVGHQGLEILSRIMGLILVAVAVQYIINGVTAIIA